MIRNTLKEEVILYSQLRHEQDNIPLINVNDYTEDELKEINTKLHIEKVNKDEPSDLKTILKLSNGSNKVYEVNDYEARLKGALMGRFAGCLLGVPVEGYSISKMEKLALDTNTPFPPTEYWHGNDIPDNIQYLKDRRGDYTLGNIHAVLVDDDITYVVLNTLLLEKYGVNYSINDVASIWLALLPVACTAEDVALENLNKGINPINVANDNPYVEWIGAAIRADAFGYVHAGNPYKAATSCYNDAYLTHRRNGIYGEMFLASAISLAFITNPLKALKEASNYIPINSRLKKDIDWTFANLDKVTDFKKARALLDERFKTMSSVHTNNNMCAIIMAIKLGNEQYTESIANAVAMGLDNDCTAASIGSIVGAYVTINGIDKKWYECFNDNIHTYLRGYDEIKISEVINKLIKIRKEIYEK